MTEVQSAASIITESIDTDAKVIFGTIHDDRLKKGEIKVTVIATGFPTERIQKQLFRYFKKNTFNSNNPNSVAGAPAENKDMKDFRDLRDKLKDDKSKDLSANKDKENDSWDVIPAFLRRNK